MGGGGGRGDAATAATKGSYMVSFGHVMLAVLPLWFIQIHGRCSGNPQETSLWERRRKRRRGRRCADSSWGDTVHLRTALWDAKEMGSSTQNMQRFMAWLRGS